MPGARVVASHEVSPEFREYERASTTAVDAYLGPVVASYLDALAAACVGAGLPEPLVMRSSGGVATVGRGGRASILGARIGPGSRRGRGGSGRARGRSSGRDLLRHGRDLDGRLPDRRWLDDPVGGARGRRAARAAPDRRSADRGRRRRLDRLARRRRSPAGRPGERGCGSRPRVLRARRHASDGDRREPPAGAPAGPARGRARRSTGPAAERALGGIDPARGGRRR